jgi:hypothetical protein
MAQVVQHLPSKIKVKTPVVLPLRPTKNKTSSIGKDMEKLESCILLVGM